MTIYIRKKFNLVGDGYVIQTSRDGENWNRWSHPDKFRNMDEADELVSLLTASHKQYGWIVFNG